jgi:type IV secretory pathway VirD2 relaxase
MSYRREDMFRVKPGVQKGADTSVERRFLSRVKMEASKLGSGVGKRTAGSSGRGAKRGRGAAIARLMDVDSSPRARRVVIKTRLVVFKQAGRRSAPMHLRYIERDGVGRDGQPGRAYSGESDAADVDAFEKHCRGDRHQFRFIVAPEDAVELEDLRAFTRQLMGKMEGDLGTRLEWVAVDHWDTDNPHTHVVLRGKEQGGENLVIGRDYISYGMRNRAGELATSWLGPRTDYEIQASLQREVEQDRFTWLDRRLQQLIKPSGEIAVGVPREGGGLRERAFLTGRLQHLQTLGLARRVDSGRWELREDMETVLQSLGERNDIIRTMQRALGAEQRELAMAGAPDSTPITGRIAAKGLSGEDPDKPYLIVDGLDGRAHHVLLPKTAELADLPIGGVIVVRQAPDSAADRNIAAIAGKGWYLTKSHIEQLRRQGRGPDRAKEIVEGHLRRLEALRRAGVVNRVADGVWEIPSDLVIQGKTYDRTRLGGLELELHSHVPIENQVRMIGATWLDRQLISPEASNSTTGFGAATRQAMKERVDFLVEQGLAEKGDGRLVVAPNLLGTLRDREIANAADRIQRETGLVHRPAKEGARVSGVYRGTVQLASGRFAMLSDGLGFELVPWRHVMDKSLGLTISGVIRSGQLSWQLSRDRQLGI